MGIFLLAGIVLLLGAVISIGDFGSNEDKTYPISVMYKNADGLIKGSQLKMGGVNVGTVTSAPELTDRGDGVGGILLARVNNDVKIQTNSRFRIETQGMMGAKFIDIVPPSKPSRDYILPGELIIGDSESDLERIKNNAMTASEEVVLLLRKIDKNSEYIEQAIKDISTAARDLSETTNKLNKGVLSEQNVKHLANIMHQVDQTTAGGPELIREAKMTTADIRKISEKANVLLTSADTKLTPVFQDVSLLATSLKKTSDNVSSVVTDVKKGQGTMGLLLYDRKFKKDFEDFVRNLRDYGILRYRDPKEAPASIDPRAGYSGSRR